MTTLLGIKTNYGIEGIVLASDRQINHWNEGSFSKKSTGNKIFYGRHCVIANTGVIGDNQFTLFQDASKKKIDQLVQEAVQKYHQNPLYEHPHFEKIAQINTALYREREDHEYLHALLLGTEIGGKFELWAVDEFGNLKQPKSKKKFEYLILGTGKKHAKKHINQLLEKGSIDETEITIPAAIDIAVAAIGKAQKDPYSSGLNLAVLTAKGADYYGDFIQEDLERQKKDMIGSIKEKYQ